jgi:hypothetical protein
MWLLSDTPVDKYMSTYLYIIAMDSPEVGIVQGILQASVLLIHRFLVVEFTKESCHAENSFVKVASLTALTYVEATRLPHGSIGRTRATNIKRLLLGVATYPCCPANTAMKFKFSVTIARIIPMICQCASLLYMLYSDR